MNFKKEFEKRIDILENLSQEQLEKMDQMAKTIIRTIVKGGKVLTAGNGGSAANAQHITGDIVGRYKLERKAYAGVTLTVDPSVMTATGNDYGYKEVFARQVEGIGNEGDVFIALSSSATSSNLDQALKKAKEKKIITMAVLGNDGGTLKANTDYCIGFPFKESDLVEEIAMAIFHVILVKVEQELAKNNKYGGKVQ